MVVVVVGVPADRLAEGQQERFRERRPMYPFSKGGLVNGACDGVGGFVLGHRLRGSRWSVPNCPKLSTCRRVGGQDPLGFSGPHPPPYQEARQGATGEAIEPIE